RGGTYCVGDGVESPTHPSRFLAGSAAPAACRVETHSGEYFRAAPIDTGPELQALAVRRNGARADDRGRPLSRRGTHPYFVRRLCGRTAYAPRTQRPRGFRAAALRRAAARFGHRRGVFAAGIIAAAAPAHGFH